MLWGIDLGGTKIEGVVLRDNASIVPICRMRIDTEAAKGYSHIIGQIQKLIGLMEKETGLDAGSVGFGTPGIVDPHTGLMKNSNTVALNGKTLKTDIEETLQKPTVFANDANCFALAEAKFGAGKGTDTVFGVIMGTGVGGGIVVDGRVLAGAQGIAGEWGHNTLDPNGEQCYCGKRGCVETLLSGPGLERFYESRTGLRRPFKEIAASADADPHARETINRLANLFGQAISVVVYVLDPDVVVLGGGVGKVDALYTDGVDALRRWVFNDQLCTRVVRPTLGDSAGVFGAAFLTASPTE